MPGQRIQNDRMPATDFQLEHLNLPALDPEGNCVEIFCAAEV
jgi:hypothetical protein